MKSQLKEGRKNNNHFFSWRHLDIGLVSEFLFDVGYKKSEIANEPGVYR